MNIEELLGAYALDAVDTDERRVVERHLAVCPRCRTEVEEHREVAAMLGGESLAAPNRVWEAIGAGFSTDDPRPAAPVVSLRGIRNGKLGWVTAVAASVMLALAAGVIAQSARIGDLSARLDDQNRRIENLAGDRAADPLRQAASAALHQPGAEVVALSSPAGDTQSTLIVVLPDGTGYLFQSNLDPLPAGRTYQLWAVVDGKVISAGVLGSRPGLVPFHIDPDGLEGLVITEESSGGVEKSESDAVVAWFEA